MRRAVLLDRDGTINAMVHHPNLGRTDSPATPDEFHLLPGVGTAIRMINEAGLLAVVVSNQPGIAKGRLTPADLDAVTSKMHDELTKIGAKLDRVFYCPHHPEGVRQEFRLVCECRKPKPGLLLESARLLQIDLSRSFLVGDTITDIQAGRAVGCRTLLLGGNCHGIQAAAGETGYPNHKVGSLLEAVEVILKEDSQAWRSS